jgi:hypothetical protein
MLFRINIHLRPSISEKSPDYTISTANPLSRLAKIANLLIELRGDLRPLQRSPIGEGALLFSDRVCEFLEREQKIT